MAVTEIKEANSSLVKLKFNSVSGEPDTSVVTATDTSLDTRFGKTSNYWAKCKVGSDEKLLFKVSASSATTVGVVKGEHYAASSEDLSVLDNETGSKVFVLESAKYANKDGYIYIYSSAACSVGAVEMP